KKSADDEAPRVRLEAVRVASFLRQWEAADAALVALNHPMDYYLTYCLTQTMKQLEPWWKPAIRDGKPFASGNPAGAEFVLASVGTGDLSNLPPGPTIYQAILSREDASAEQRTSALAA